MSDPYKVPAAPPENAIFQTHSRYLFLQGPIGPFFSRLAKRLLKSGNEVHHIALSGGDRIFWNAGHTLDYTGGAEGWPAFLEKALGDLRITDIVLFGDCRPLHRVAISIGEARGIHIHVCEEGYLRPNWLTLERDGVNRHSSLSRDPAWYISHAQNLAPWHPGIPVSGSFFRRAVEDVIYRLSTLLLSWRYVGYRTHKPWSPMAEYWSGARRFFFTPLARRRSAKLAAGILAKAQNFYLLPLQLEADSQIRFHSSMGSMIPAIKQIIDSFAGNAPADSLLVVTEHPLDTGVVDLGRVTQQYAAETGVADRVVFMRGGSPEQLLRASQGVITVNSTLGILALDFNLPVKTLGHAIYDLPGLTFQGELDQFWQQKTAPDRMLFDCFRRVVAAESQINGGLYSHDGLMLAVDAAARKLSATTPMARMIVTMPQLGELSLQSCK